MRRLPAIFVLCAWLFASGAQWDMVQGFAWARMFVSYSQTMPLAKALKKTFQSDNLCGVCEFVADAKTRSDADRPSANDTVPRDPGLKVTLFLPCSPAVAITTPTLSTQSLCLDDPAASSRARPAPPTEPPRHLAA